MTVALVYVTGHRNPDTDSIASAIGYAELKRRVDPGNEYVPVRLGELNAQEAFIRGLIRLTGDQQKLIESQPVFGALDTVFNNVRGDTDYR